MRVKACTSQAALGEMLLQILCILRLVIEHRQAPALAAVSGDEQASNLERRTRARIGRGHHHPLFAGTDRDERIAFGIAQGDAHDQLAQHANPAGVEHGVDVVFGGASEKTCPIVSPKWAATFWISSNSQAVGSRHAPVHERIAHPEDLRDGRDVPAGRQGMPVQKRAHVARRHWGSVAALRDVRRLGSRGWSRHGGNGDRRRVLRSILDSREPESLENVNGRTDSAARQSEIDIGCGAGW
jgi:hypothetical protein